MRAPFRGCPAAYSARIAISAGISDSAIAISLRPQSASERSATRKSLNFESAAFIHYLQKDKAPAPFPMRAPLNLAEPDPRLPPGDATLLSGADSNRSYFLFLAGQNLHPRAVATSIVASVVFLRIQDFARRPASEQARLRAQLEAVLAVTTADAEPAGRTLTLVA